MTSLLAIGLLWTGQSAYTATFADVWDRWKKVDAAWALGDSKPRQGEAIPHLRAAAGQMYVSRWSEACESLDEALAHLESRPWGPEMAVSLRFRPPVAEPGRPARLVVSWAYRPRNPRPFNLQIGNRRLVLQPGRNLTLDVLPSQLEPELSRNPELGVPLTAAVGSVTRTIVLSILKSPRTRIAKLLQHESDTVRNLGQKALTMMEAPVPAEPATSLLSTISVAEELAEGAARITQLRTIPYARRGGTGMQISVPRDLARDGSNRITLVVGIAGFGGEAGFFEGLGQGSAPDEAGRRGWVFVGATPSENAVGNVVEWVQTHLKLQVGRIFALGFGTGSAAALEANEWKPATAGVALLSPVNAVLPRKWAENPLFIAAGRQDAARFLNPLQVMARELGSRPTFKFHEIEGCEHLTLPVEGIPAAFAFFDMLSRGSRD